MSPFLALTLSGILVFAAVFMIVSAARSDTMAGPNRARLIVIGACTLVTGLFLGMFLPGTGSTNNMLPIAIVGGALLGAIAAVVRHSGRKSA